MHSASNTPRARSGSVETPMPPPTTKIPILRYSRAISSARGRTSTVVEIPTRSVSGEGTCGAMFSFTTSAECPASSTMPAIVKSPRCGAILAFSEVSIGLLAALGCISRTCNNSYRSGRALYSPLLCSRQYLRKRLAVMGMRIRIKRTYLAIELLRTCRVARML